LLLDKIRFLCKRSLFGFVDTAFETRKILGLHGVVNNAGVLGNTFFDDFLTIEDYKRTADVNLWGAIRIVQAFKPLVKGRIVTTTSICGRYALMGTGPYTVSKFALTGYCDTIRTELRLFGVSVHVLEPGFFTTHLTSRKNVEVGFLAALSCPEEVKLEYGKEFFYKMRKKTFWLLGLMSSRQINHVTEAYYHALTAVYPRARYHVGWDSILVFTPLSIFPTELQDLITRILLLVMKIPSPALVSQKVKSF
uniref:Retinol dehydrogenase 11 n=1 Tax=Angiostrongylus cantonensis TaxID=6313 RepID=A0A0K0CYK1_ANGCA